MIVTSKTFKKFFETNIIKKYHININLDTVGEMIVGYVGKNTKEAFLVEVINGAFDADKLDYIQRDCHFTGIKMVLDLPRLFYTVEPFELQKKLRLTE